jgi:hypothetical protein
MKAKYISLRVVLYIDTSLIFQHRLLRIMREVISVHVGQAGVWIGNVCCTCTARQSSRRQSF